MLDPKIKSKIEKLWNMFWAGGLANPLTAIEQMSYLIFMKRLEDLIGEREQGIVDGAVELEASVEKLRRTPIVQQRQPAVEFDLLVEEELVEGRIFDLLDRNLKQLSLGE